MAEEDEIDVLGEFSLDNFLSKNVSSVYDSSALVSQNSELLNCDYTIHPQWLLDKPSPNPDNWYDINLSNEVLEREQTGNDALGLVSTENSITDESGWTEKEKNLLERGIEIFGKSNVRLSQFIGSKTAAEIKYYLRNYYSENQVYKTLNEGVVEEVNDNNLISDVLNDTQIPASIEEVIAAVSTAKPTIPTHNKKIRKKSPSYSSDTDSTDVTSGQSILKSNYLNLPSQPVTKLKNLVYNNQRRKIKEKPVKYKNRTKEKIKTDKDLVKQTLSKSVDMENDIKFSKVEITTGKGLAVPICKGEQIVKIEKVDDSETDIEIDVEDSDEEIKTETQSKNEQPEKCPQKITEQTEQSVGNIQHNENNSKTETKSENEIKTIVDLAMLKESTVEELMGIEYPTCEIILDEGNISELEKVFNYKFFENRPTKTPLKYLKIRNHIIKLWVSQKPNYVTKTSVRQGLNNCGDVNCISRIHYFLEQIGAINYGCAQVNYERPLYNMIQTDHTVRDKSIKDTKMQPRPISDLGSRQRIKRKFTNDGEGGCTLTHDEKGHVINTIVVNEEPVSKQRVTIKKPIRLIYCRPFSEAKPQPYTIKLCLSTLLTMDFHAHTSLTEVMGLVAGYWIPHNKTLTVSHFEPCLNIASSATHCDMCPISQAKAADAIHGKGLDILGWFHSHPTFAPEPSHQDMETQQYVQQWIGCNKPCIGVILSPFSLNGALIASPFRCFVVDKKDSEEQIVPYKFEIAIDSEDFDIKEFLLSIWKVFRLDGGSGGKARVDFDKPYFQDMSISYLEKYITSLRMWLAKCGTINKMTCDNVIQGISDICNRKENN